MARINLCPNPSLKNNANDFFGGGARVTNAEDLPRSTAWRSNGGGEVTCPRGSVVAGVTYRFSAWLFAHGAITAQANINWYSNGSYLSSSPGVAFTAAAPGGGGESGSGSGTQGNVVRVESGARTAPAGADQALLNLTGLDAVVDVTALLYSPSSALTEFFDGDTSEASWNGTNGNSTSSIPSGDDDTATPPPPNPGGDPGSSDRASVTQGWGQPIYFQDFDTQAAMNDISRYNGPGHVGNGLRRPERWSIEDSILRITGLPGSPNTGGAAHVAIPNRQYGRWEVRARAYNFGGGSGRQYHPVLEIWAETENWPLNGEYCFWEVNVGDTGAGSWIHYPHNAGIPTQQIFAGMAGVRPADWHNYAFAWYPTGVIGYIDGREWYRYSGGANSVRKNIQDMTGGHLTIQLDAFGPENHQGARQEVDWIGVWNHTSFSSTTAVSSAGGIPRRSNQVGSHLVGNRFRLYLTNSSATATTALTPVWDQTSGAVTGRLLGTGRAGANAAVAVAETSTSNQHDAALGQWVSEPMTSGGLLQGGFGYVLARQESSTSADLVSHVVLKVVSGDGATVRGVAADLINPTEWGTTLQGIAVSGTITSPVNCLTGDRLVVELGYRATNVVATSFTGTIRYGGANDLEHLDSGSSATTLSPWINFADRGVERLFRGQTVTLTAGIPTAEAHGTPLLIQPPTQDVSPTGITGTSVVSSPTVVAQARILNPDGIPPGVMGSPSVNLHVAALGIASGEAVGLLRVRRATDLYLEAGIPSGEQIGALTLVYFQELAPQGIQSTAVFGLTEVEDPHRRIVVDFGIPSTAVVGIPGGSIYKLHTTSIPPRLTFGSKKLAVLRAKWQLVNPTRIERYRLGDPTNVIYVKNVVAATVWGTGSDLDSAENPRSEDLDEAQYVWLGGHANITEDIVIRDLWLANGFDVETVY